MKATAVSNNLMNEYLIDWPKYNYEKYHVIHWLFAT